MWSVAIIIMAVVAVIMIMSRLYWQLILGMALLGGVLAGLAGIAGLMDRGVDRIAGAVLIVGSLLVLCFAAAIIQRATSAKENKP